MLDFSWLTAVLSTPMAQDDAAERHQARQWMMLHFLKKWPWRFGYLMTLRLWPIYTHLRTGHQQHFFFDLLSDLLVWIGAPWLGGKISGFWSHEMMTVRIIHFQKFTIFLTVSLLMPGEATTQFLTAWGRSCSPPSWDWATGPACSRAQTKWLGHICWWKKSCTEMYIYRTLKIMR